MIVMNDFSSEPEALKSASQQAFARVLNSGVFVLGEEVERFEKSWAKFCGARYSTGVANGMDAIEIILRGLEIEEGDEVVLPAITAFATVLAVIRAGAVPVLADIDIDTGLMSMESVERCMTERTRVILLVHLFGHLRDSKAWSALAHKYGVFLIEDCAQSHGAIEDGRTAGSIGHASAFSFYPTKNLGALGDAGAIVTSDSRLFDKSRSLRNYGQSERYLHPDIGLNSRLDEVQAAILSERLAWLPVFTSRRREISSKYREMIDNRFVSFLSPPRQAENHVYHLFVVRTEKREVFQRHMQERGVQTLIHYPVPLHLQSSVEGIRRDPDGLGRAEIFANQCVSLPCHPQLTEADIELVSSATNSFKA